MIDSSKKSNNDKIFFFSKILIILKFKLSKIKFLILKISKLLFDKIKEYNNSFLQ
jgi:hypothetical protein